MSKEQMTFCVADRLANIAINTKADLEKCYEEKNRAA